MLIAQKVQKIEEVFGSVSPPPQLQKLTNQVGASGLKGGGASISFFLNTVIELIFTVAVVITVFMVVIGAVQMIMSGGDKEALASARKRITYAIIGMVLLALSFVILRIIGQILGFEFFSFTVTPPRLIPGVI